VFCAIAGLALAILFFVENNLLATTLSFKEILLVCLVRVAAATDAKHGNVVNNNIPSLNINFLD
jgi:hypothetical protein